MFNSDNNIFDEKEDNCDVALNGDVFYSYNNFYENEDYNDNNEIINKYNYSYEDKNNIHLGTPKPEDYKQKNNTEIAKNKINTKDTESNNKSGIFLAKKRNNKKNINEKEEEKEDEIINIKKAIFEITKIKNKKNKTGKKSKCIKKHDKFASDNVVRKIKRILFETLIRFINDSIKTYKNNKSNQNVEKMETTPFLVKINQKTISDTSKKSNIELIDSSLQDIFSRDVSVKMKNYGIDKNRKTIQEIIKNNQKRTMEILNMTLEQCFDHLTGKCFYNELAGLEFDNIINELKNKGETDEFYIQSFTEEFNQFVNKYRNKRSKTKKAKIISEKNDKVKTLSF